MTCRSCKVSRVKMQTDWDRCGSATPTTSSSHTAKILIIYAGGTIGMHKTATSGYYPTAEHGYLMGVCENNPVFHLPPGNSVKAPVPALGKVLSMPPSIFGKNICYQILEYSPLLDSSNMTVGDWVKIAADIETYYHNFDAFVILHGTDTMAYTASALSFMLENLGKTVILTGSQIPLCELRNDATSNFLGAMTIAGHYIIPEVTLFFCNKLYRGNRTIKANLSAFEAFESPNCKPLASLGIHIEIDWTNIWRPLDPKPLQVHKILNSNVTCLRLFPGITETTVKAILSASVDGVVLETFGAGNAPDNRPDLLAAIREASDRGCIIVNISQCRTGIVSDLYATGKALSQAGVIPGMDMTTECALTKLSYLLGLPGLTRHDVRKFVGENLRGELTKPVLHSHLPLSDLRQSSLAETFHTIMDSVPPSIRERVDVLLKMHFFHLAASNNDVAGMEKLLRGERSRSFCIDSIDYMDRTPLMTAVSNRSVDVVKWLLRLGASVHGVDRRGRNAIEEAIEWYLFKGDPIFLQIADLLHEVGSRPSLDYIERNPAIMGNPSASQIITKYSS